MTNFISNVQSNSVLHGKILDSENVRKKEKANAELFFLRTMISLLRCHLFLAFKMTIL